MNESQNICPKCQTGRTELKGGLVYCPNCGFDGEEKKHVEEVKARSAQNIFWIALTAPAALALLSFLTGKIFVNSPGLAVGIGMVGLVGGLFTSIYCGLWLSRRIPVPEGFQVILGLLFIFGIGFVNFMILCAGCGPNLRFR